MAATRRNGLLSSCEPCRKSKLRCDHATPTCGRCHRRGKAVLCVYHPAPMTKHWNSDASGSPTLPPIHYPDSQRSSLGTDRTSPPSLSWTYTSSRNPGQVQDRKGPLRDKYIAEWSKRTPLFSNPGFLGLTSYSAVFSESESSLGVSKTHNIGVALRDLSTSCNPSKHIIDDGQVQLGAELLLLLFDDFALYEKISLTAGDICEGYIFGYPMIRFIFNAVNAVRDMYNRSVLEFTDQQASMRSLSRVMFEGCSDPITIQASMTPQEYFSSISRRWEIIGLAFSMAGVGASLITPSDLIFTQERVPPIDHKGLGILAAAAGDICLKFCDNAGIMSEPLSWLLLSHTHLLTLVHGDNDYRSWSRLGELSTLIFALGFHQAENDIKIPFWLAEHRKRLMGATYIIDKELATFLGRPPRVSWRYCDMQLPLDLSYEDTLAAPAIRDGMIARLDINGWNTEGSVTNAARSRVAYCLGYIRELVLEVSLSQRGDDLPRRVEEISLLSHKMRDDLPPFLHWTDGNEPAGASDQSILLPLYLHLDFLYNDFLLQRILVKRTGIGPETLVNISHQILTTLLILIAKRTRCARTTNALGWSVSYFGLPSAGVLAVELLRHTQSQQPQLSFNRSEVIQNLSIFASDLEFAILPQSGNYDICQQARKVIRHILDRVLTAQANSSMPVIPESVMPVDWLNDDGAWLTDSTDFIKWMDSLDWGQTALA